MPVLDSEHGTTKRSALRYRPLTTDEQVQPAPVATRARKSRPAGRAPVVPDDLGLEGGERVPGRRSVPAAPRRSAPPVRTRQRIHPLLFVSLGLLLTIFLWIGINQVMSWGNDQLNTLTYGDPRTYQVDAVVGQGDSREHPSHFIAVNLHGSVTIIEFPHGDPSRALVLATISVQGPDADQAVVTLRFIDVSNDGKPDMIIDIESVQSLLVNTGTGFRPPTATEQQQIFLYLQQHP